MSITKKLTLISIAGVLILGVLAMTISVQSLNKRGHSEIETMKETLMAEKREKLQDLIGNTYAILEDKYQAAHDTAMVANAYKQQLKSIVEVAYTAVEKIHNDGYLNTLDKQQPAINMIKAMRYQGKDYLWINDTGLKMVMHPVKPALNGKNMSDFKDPEGKYIFREFLKVCQNNGEGFVDYMWPKPGFDNPVPKLSYVKLFKPWGWIIGTGVYLEAAEEMFQTQAKAAISSLRFGKQAKDYFWINDNRLKMVMHPVKPALNGKNMSDFKDPEGKYIFREFLKVCQNNGEGFVDYMWPKPGFDNPVAKLSYVKLFKEWGWIVGTGIYLDDVDRIVAEKQAQIRSQLAVQRNWIIGIMMAILLVTGAVVLITTRRIATSITSASIMLKDIAQGEGDLTRTLKVQSNDEVGEMAGWFNLFVKKIRDLVAEVKDKTLHLDESSQDLSGISEHMSTGTDQTSAKANKVSEAAGTMSANVTSMAATMQEASSNITMVAAAVEQMTSTINEIAHNTGKASTITGDAVHQAGQASQQVSELGAAAQKIGKVVEAITEISEQVNLLALNATIEAARAGEAGKGFAVVANEIKDLARQTAEATGEIKQKVIDIQSSTKGTVTQISAITEVVHQVDEIVSTISAAVEEQSVATKEIAINITQASEGIGDVSNKVTENSEFSSSIAQEILEVTRATGEMASNSSQVNNQAGELAGLSHTLNTIVGQFKV